LHSSISFWGINFHVKSVNKGRIIRSSKYPKIGIKPGIKSISDKAYPIIILMGHIGAKCMAFCRFLIGSCLKTEVLNNSNEKRIDQINIVG
jgi:hypothetical protein